MKDWGGLLVLIVVLLTIGTTGWTLIERAARRRPPIDPPCPWPVDDIRPAHVLNSPPHNIAGDKM